MFHKRLASKQPIYSLRLQNYVKFYLFSSLQSTSALRAIGIHYTLQMA